MLIFVVTTSAIAVMLFVEWQYSIISRRVQARAQRRPESDAASRARRR